MRHRFSQYCARGVAALLNLRVLVALIAMVLVALPNHPQRLGPLQAEWQAFIFRIGLALSELPAPKTPVTLVHVPDLEYERWLVDLPGSASWYSLLEALDTEQPGVLGLLLEQPLVLIQPEAESVLQSLYGLRGGARLPPKERELYQQAASLFERRNTIADGLKEARVLLGTEEYTSGAQRLRVADAALAEYPSWMRAWLWPAPPRKTFKRVSPVLHYLPAALDDGVRQPLLLRDGDRLMPGFVLSFWLAGMAQLEAASDDAEDEARFVLATADQSANPLLIPEMRLPRGGGADGLLWQRDWGLISGATSVPASTFGDLVPLYGSLSGVRPSFRQISLGAALNHNNLSGWVLVGRDGSESLERSAQLLAALGDKAYLVEPYWWSPLNKSLLLGLLAWALWGLSHWGVKRSLYTLLVVLGALAAVQVWAQCLRGWWLPTGEAALFACGALILMLVWRVQRYAIHVRQVSNLQTG